MSGAQLSWERENWAARYWSGWLKQEAANERVKPLITYCDSIIKRLKSEKMLIPRSITFIEWNGVPVKDQVGQHGCGNLLREPQAEGSCSVMNSEVERGVEG